MTNALKIKLAEDIARVFGGQTLAFSFKLPFINGFGNVEFQTVRAEGIVIGHDEENVVISSDRGPYQKLDPSWKLTSPGPGPYFASDADLVVPVPLRPKVPLIAKFPHRCNRCTMEAQEFFRTIDCSNWRCPNYYLR